MYARTQRTVLIMKLSILAKKFQSIGKVRENEVQNTSFSAKCAEKGSKSSKNLHEISIIAILDNPDKFWNVFLVIRGVFNFNL